MCLMLLSLVDINHRYSEANEMDYLMKQMFIVIIINKCSYLFNICIISSDLTKTIKHQNQVKSTINSPCKFPVEKQNTAIFLVYT